MKMAALVVILALGTLAAPITGWPQPAGKTPRVGCLWTLSSGDPVGQRFVEAFRQGLRELGWVEGQNIAIDCRWADGRYERLPALAAELVGLNVDVIVTSITSAALAARNATQTVPIVMTAVVDPVRAGLVASLARPGGNVTGLSLLLVELSAKQLELLKETFPRLSRVAVLRNPSSASHSLIVEQAEQAARTLGIRLHTVAARGPEEFSGAFAEIARERAEALLVLPDSVFVSQRARLAELVARARLPAMYAVTEHAEAGGLMTYAASVRDNYRRAATYVDKILKGARPGDLPVEQPTRFELVINLKTAKALGLTIPTSVLVRADRVVE